MSLKKLLITISLLLLMVGCDTKSSGEKELKKDTNKTEQTSNLNKAQKEISFRVETIDSKVFHIKDMPNGLKFEELKDKAVLVVFFGYKCPPCLREIPRLNKLASKHKEDLEIVAFEVQGLSGDDLREFVKEKNIQYNVIEGLKYMEFISYIQYRAQWQGAIPYLIALNKKGEVEFAQVGGLFDKELEYIYKEITKDSK